MSYYQDVQNKIAVGVVRGLHLGQSIDRWIESQCEAVAKGGAVTQWIDPTLCLIRDQGGKILSRPS